MRFKILRSALMLLIALTASGEARADDKADLPACDDAAVKRTAAEAIEDMYFRVGLGGTASMKSISGLVRSGLGPYQLDDREMRERAIARALGYGGEHVRLCSVDYNEQSRVIAWIATNPQDHDTWVMAVSNIGLGDNGVAESLPQSK